MCMKDVTDEVTAALLTMVIQRLWLCLCDDSAKTSPQCGSVFLLFSDFLSLDFQCRDDVSELE